MNDFNGQVVLITGAGQGAGRALAEATRAWPPMMFRLSTSRRSSGQSLNAEGVQTHPFDDIAKKVGAQALLKNVEDDFGSVDLLVSHAAVEPHGPLLELDEWDWPRTLEVNLTGAFLMIQSVGRKMREKGWGVISNIVPQAGREVGEEAGGLSSEYGGAGWLTRAAEKEVVLEFTLRRRAARIGSRTKLHSCASPR